MMQESRFIGDSPMRFFNEKGFARYQKSDGGTDWDRLWGDYGKYLMSIRDQLSPAWQHLAEADLHDRDIVSIEQPSRGEFIMDLEEMKLTFTGVKFVWVPKSAVGDRWVYWEVSPSDRGGVDLEVRLGRDEIRIIADDVWITKHSRSRPGVR